MLKPSSTPLPTPSLLPSGERLRAPSTAAARPLPPPCWIVRPRSSPASPSDRAVDAASPKCAPLPAPPMRAPARLVTVDDEPCSGRCAIVGGTGREAAGMRHEAAMTGSTVEGSETLPPPPLGAAVAAATAAPASPRRAWALLGTVVWRGEAAVPGPAVAGSATAPDVTSRECAADRVSSMLRTVARCVGAAAA